jgi:hypothetical protein
LDLGHQRVIVFGLHLRAEALTQTSVPIELEPPNGEPASLDLYRRQSLAIFMDSSLGIKAFYELSSICHDNQFRLLK